MPPRPFPIYLNHLIFSPLPDLFAKILRNEGRSFRRDRRLFPQQIRNARRIHDWYKDSSCVSAVWARWEIFLWRKLLICRFALIGADVWITEYHPVHRVCGSEKVDAVSRDNTIRSQNSCPRKHRIWIRSYSPANPKLEFHRRHMIQYHPNAVLLGTEDTGSIKPASSRMSSKLRCKNNTIRIVVTPLGIPLPDSTFWYQRTDTDTASATSRCV